MTLDLLDIVAPHLSEEDDPTFWKTAVPEALLQCVFTETTRRKSPPVFAQIGMCAHWLRPHQTRWAESGGFAWPAGYGGGLFSRSGLPEFEWSVLIRHMPEEDTWIPVQRLKGKKKLVLRLAAPNRTSRHQQAVVHTVWSPGSPQDPTQKQRRIFGFRKHNDIWTCEADQILSRHGAA